MDEVVSFASRLILVTSYSTESRTPSHLGDPGYSYGIVARLFWPLLSRWGRVVHIADPADNLDNAVQQAQSSGLTPIHVSFRAFHDVHYSTLAPNIVVPFWEYPDIPVTAFDGNPRSNWAEVANQSSRILVAGDFTANAFRRGGVQVPLDTVPVPTPQQYFELPTWTPDQRVRIESPTYSPKLQTHVSDSLLNKIRRRLDESLRAISNSLVARVPLVRTALIQSERTLNRLNSRRDSSGQLPRFDLPYHSEPEVQPTGVVYSSILNPSCGRKNWFDLLSAFQVALSDCEDATLLVKLVTTRPREAMRVIRFYLSRGIPHRCQVLFLCDYMKDTELLNLAAASTYYIQSTHAEGSCLPLMNAMAAGRPAVSPCHTAISDYFDSDLGFVVDSHPEPTAWPQDRSRKWRTTWQRIVWSSLVDQIRESYRVATQDYERYIEYSQHCRSRMSDWAHASPVTRRLHSALDAALQSGTHIAPNTNPNARAA